MSVKKALEAFEQKTSWGWRMNALADKVGPLHLLAAGNAPACGVSYRSMSGAVKLADFKGSPLCKRCALIYQKRHKAHRLSQGAFGGGL